MLDSEKWRSYYGDQPGGIIWPYPNGDRFRSKTEAHWAVFFDALGIKYEYEPQWFNGNLNYRPDFLIPSEYRNTWVEIKPPRPINKVEREKAYRLAFKTHSNVLIFCGHPWDFWGESYHWHWTINLCGVCGYIGYIFPEECPKCGWGDFGRDEQGEFWSSYRPIAWDVYNDKKLKFHFLDLRKGPRVINDAYFDKFIPKPHQYNGPPLNLYKADLTQALHISRTTRFDYWIRN